MDLLSLATEATDEEFHTDAMDWLKARIGFDGVIWGSGERQVDGTVAIMQHFLDGRPTGLINDYPRFAHADPVSQHFGETPQLLQNVSTHSFYNQPELADMRDYLEHYRVRHLLLKGGYQPGNAMLDWLVLYREDHGRPFDESMIAISDRAISTVLLAAMFQRSAKACLQLASVSVPDGAVDANPYTHITERQQQVLCCLLQGWSNKLIARHLAISENTLKTHLAAVYKALHVTSRSQAIIVAGRLCRYFGSDSSVS